MPRRPVYESPILRFRVRILGGYYASRDSANIWRDIEIAGNQTLADLGEAIPIAFDFDDPHLWSFFMSRKAWDKSTEYKVKMDFDDEDNLRPSADQVLIRDVPYPGVGGKKEFLFLFDYGDEWHFGVKLRGKRDHVEPGQQYPCMAAEHGEAPPQYPNMEDDWDEDDES